MNVELKNPKVIFNNVWNKLKQTHGEENMVFPAEILVSIIDYKTLQID